MQSPDTSDRAGANRLAIALATGFGSGLAPVASGTFGTLVAVPLAWLLLRETSAYPMVQLVLVAAAAAIAIWSANVAALHFGLKDPGQIVVDEIAGYLVTVALLPPGWATLLAAFVLFRVFDIAKPPPCRWAEGLPGGVGIVADDLLAGLYANLSIRILCIFGILSL